MTYQPLGLVMADLDGTTALFKHHRGPFDYDQVSADAPNIPVIRTIEALARDGRTIVFMSGREQVPGCYEDTHAWLKRHVDVPDFELYMRAFEDHRRDAIVKAELYYAHVAPRPVLLVLDDRDQVVDGWRALGLSCFQVAPGNF